METTLGSLTCCQPLLCSWDLHCNPHPGLSLFGCGAKEGKFKRAHFLQYRFWAIWLWLPWWMKLVDLLFCFHLFEEKSALRTVACTWSTFFFKPGFVHLAQSLKCTITGMALMLGMAAEFLVYGFISQGQQAMPLPCSSVWCRSVLAKAAEMMWSESVHISTEWNPEAEWFSDMSKKSILWWLHAWRMLSLKWAGFCEGWFQLHSDTEQVALLLISTGALKGLEPGWPWCHMPIYLLWLQCISSRNLWDFWAAKLAKAKHPTSPGCTQQMLHFLFYIARRKYNSSMHHCGRDELSLLEIWAPFHLFLFFRNIWELREQY